MVFRRLITACLLMAVISPTLADELLVSAAASLTNAFRDLATQFEAQRPGTTVLTTFGASDLVLRQIIYGAPADVFASADQLAMDKAVEARVVDPTTRKNFVRNELVLIVPRDNPGGILSTKDLQGAAVKRIAFGNPASVPVGRYTQAALRASGDWAGVHQREVLGQNVRQVLSYVERGEVEAGFVFATDAAIMHDKVKVVQTLPTPTPVLYPIALVKREGRRASAQAFLDYVLSEEGQVVLAKYGFSRP
ncbi:molybdate ABC transporter substrate-binding protein [Alcaligenaceae bacterium CGII-47]|nr:molybdate ABC transporter substrate-binding protein [Alcaligenaceae bacterium CGII-47]